MLASDSFRCGDATYAEFGPLRFWHVLAVLLVDVA